MNVYTFLQHTDEIILRTYTVQNDVTFRNGKRGSFQEKVCFMRSEVLKTELIAHLPPLTAPHLSLVDIILTKEEYDRAWAEFDATGKDPYIRVPSHRPTPLERYNHELEHARWRAQQDSGFVASQYASLGDLSFLGGPEEIAAGKAAVLIEKEPFLPDRILMEFSEPGDVITAVSWVGSAPPSKTIMTGAEPVCIPEIVYQTLFGIRAVLLTLLDAGGRLCVDEDYLGTSPVACVFTALDIMTSWSAKSFVPNVKYWKDYSLAVFLRNPPPKVPETWPFATWDPLFSGRLREFWRRMAHPTECSDAPEIFRANFSIAQSKRGFATVPEEFKRSSYQGHAQKLSTPPPPQAPEVTADLKTFINVFFRNFRPRDLIGSLTQREATTSATNKASRAQGGGRAELRAGLKYRFDTNADGLTRMVPLDQGVVEERGLLPPTRDEWLSIAKEPIEFGYESLPPKLKELIPISWRTKPFCKVIALQEPLKIRIITKMQGLSSFLAGPLQKALWTYLKRFPCFDLTSRTFSEENVYDMMERERKLHGDRTADFVSGDYSAATDGLDIQATKLVLEAIEAKLVGEDRHLIPHLRAVLLEQVLIYPKDAQQDPVLQKNGQLMGSVLSFPILCILNLFTYIQSLPDKVRRDFLHGRRAFRLLPVLVNGDDILFRSDPEQYQRWLAATKSVGFTLSLGKNFVHSRYMTVNSLPIVFDESVPARLVKTGRITSWTLSEPFSEQLSIPTKIPWADLDELDETHPWVFKKSHKFRVLGYINLGLLLNLAETTDERGRHGLVPLSSWYEWAVIGSMNPVRAHNLFLHYHKEGIARQTRFGKWTLNLFAHPLLGGLGFKVPEGVTPRFSEPQRHLAYRLLEAAKQEFVGPAEDHPLRPFTRLTAINTVETSIGTLGARRFISATLDTPVGPLEDGRSQFDSDFTVRANPLVVDYFEPEPTELVASCRLSNDELRRLLKGSNHGRKELLPIGEMTSFPYRIVTYKPKEEEVPVVAESAPIESPPSPPTIVVELESWEYLPVVSRPFTASDLREKSRTLKSTKTPATSSVKARLREDYRVRASQGLLPDYTPSRTGRYSRKGGNKW